MGKICNELLPIKVTAHETLTNSSALSFKMQYVAMRYYSKGVDKGTDSKVHGANMGPIWGRQDPGGPHAGPMNFAIWDLL